jgi:pyruvate,water dikinase
VATEKRWTIPLSEAGRTSPSKVGGKAVNLSRLAAGGFRTPNGFCVPVASYERFVSEARLESVIGMELGRKPFAEMRWEEIWDAALRIRSAFGQADVPQPIADAIRRSVNELGPAKPLAVRSSSPGEDSAKRSFAGLHESYLGVVGPEAVLDAIRLVWASLWSDAALLYRKELDLDPFRSRMAVVIQEIVTEECSGVTFGRDPRQMSLDRAIIEAVSGPCSELVDGHVDPDRWILKRSTGEVLEWRPGERDSAAPPSPLLAEDNVDALHRCLRTVESLFGWPPDVEWTGTGERLTLLQARPITDPDNRSDDTREWYLSLRPDTERLARLAHKVSEELIPELRREGDELANEAVESLDDLGLSSAIRKRFDALKRWKKIYWDEFIPFAHGVRHLATYYNDAVRPKDPYEFVGLLQGEEMLATQRNRILQELASSLARNRALLSSIETFTVDRGDRTDDWRSELSHSISEVPGGDAFLKQFERFQSSFMDISFAGERLIDRSESLFPLLLEMAKSKDQAGLDSKTEEKEVSSVKAMEHRLFEAVGETRRQEATDVLRIARLSWRLRDDDNLLLGKVESQLLRVLRLAARRLRHSGRLKGREPNEKDAAMLIRALDNPNLDEVDLSEANGVDEASTTDEDATPRQIVGQPAAPGFATGRVKRIRTADDIARFHAGEILVCDAIQPSMTHLVPLAGAIVERRGGMLIHGAIIARELGIPCVNGIARASEILGDGDLVTVDGYLGIVTVGATDFELEKAFSTVDG